MMRSQRRATGPRRPGRRTSRAGVVLAATSIAVALALTLGGCGDRIERVSAATAADAVAETVMAHRLSYTQSVVERLDREGVLRADEDWQARRTLPLPAQMLRMSSEHVARSKSGELASFVLVSEWAINKVNRPRSSFERDGLAALRRDPARPWRGVQDVGGKRYFSSLYADRAVTRACADCHNAHPDSPRHDFKLGDTMGALVVSLALDD